MFTLLKSAKLFEYEWDWFVCQDFVSMEGRILILRSLSASSSHLKIKKKKEKKGISYLNELPCWKHCPPPPWQGFGIHGFFWLWHLSPEYSAWQSQVTFCIKIGLLKIVLPLSVISVCFKISVFLEHFPLCKHGLSSQGS